MQRHSKAVEPISPNAETMWSMDPQSIATVAKAYGAWVSQANKMRDETMRFAHERFTKELDAAVQLARCTNANEALAVQTEFANKMAEDYLAEGKKLVKLMGEIAKEFTSSPKSSRVHH
ncbi:MAG: phasin family protein [Casimicrobiaceae bacterium]